ncbi:hypothetical protein [Chryseobacterium aurantiacum]|uniref:hypothetical protein n=1 Tax=Chryseobacterium aurantiacum TaxID=2116499 RepID=UPI000D115461|nr:hypothetical protein [Chryseobacterium aurantiacum]
MKKFKLLKIAVFSLLAFTTSCHEELTETLSNKTNIIEQASVRNGRLYFPNKESLAVTYKELKKKNLESVQNFIDERGIESLIPIITEKNETEVLSELKSRKIEYLKKNSYNTAKIVTINDADIYEDLDDLEEIVGDDVYAAMLNGNAEIQVADNVYKYTDVGLFVTHINNYTNLENYLDVRKISSNLLEPTESSVREDFVTDKMAGELISLPDASNIEYFVAKIQPLKYDDGGGSGGSTSTPTAEPSIATIVQNLPIGAVRKPWLGNLFGKTWETDDKYESRRRVKVKFYSQNLFLVYAIGCKVKHQYRGWTGLWRKENADQLGIGVNSIKWTFNHSMNMNAPAGVPKQAYWFGSNMYTTSNGISFTFSQNQNIPSLPFASKIDGIIQFAVNVSSLTEEQLDKLFWENAWMQANKLLEGQNKKLNRVAFVVDSYSASYVRYYDFSQIEYNQDVIERIFDWGVSSPQFTYTFGGGTGNGLAATSYNWNFSKPDAVAVSMYGIAKKNGAWHGVKLNTN